MKSNEKKDNRIVILERFIGWVLTIGAILMIVYLSRVLIPSILINYEAAKTSAKIESIDTTKNEYLLRYSYKNKYNGNEYRLVRKIGDQEIDKYRDIRYINISYTKFFPTYVKFEDGDKKSPSTLYAIAIIFCLISAYMTGKVALGKLSLDDVFN